MTKLKIDKTNWKPIKFGDVVYEPKETAKDLIVENIEHVVGLEHIDSDDIHLRRSASIQESTTFTKKFAKGDVLFGRRRAYLRKAAQAEFEGICSGDITVFRAKPALSIRLLPFLVNNDAFFDYAVKHSAGGLSPRVKFRDLADYEFLLPPLEEQEKLAELLWAMDEVIERDSSTCNSYNKYFKRFMYDTISGKLSNKSIQWKEHVFGDLGDTYGGINGKTKTDFGKGMPFITYLNVFKNSVTDLQQTELVDIKEGEKQNEIKYGDILITGSSETPNELGMSSVVLDNVRNTYLNSFCFGFRLHDFNKLIPDYARFLMRGSEVRNFMVLHAQGSTRFNLSKETLKKKLRVRLPDIEEQKIIAQELNKLEELTRKVSQKIDASKALQKSLINQLF